MFSHHEPEVLVVGAGPVGLTAALSLARRSVGVEIVDEEIRTAAHSYGLALHPGTLSLLSRLGIAPSQFDQSVRVDRVSFWQGNERRAELRLDRLDCEHPYLVVVRQSHLEDTLERALRNEKVKVKWQHRLGEFRPEADRVVGEVQKLDKVSSGYAIAGSETEVAKRIRREPRFLIGADGHRSEIRQRLGIEFRQIGPAETFAVFEFDCEPPLDEHEVCVAIDGRTTDVLWPLPDGRCRWSFQVFDEPGTPYDTHFKSRLAVQVGRDFFPHVTPELLSKLIEERAPWFGSWPGRIYWSVLARFERRLASSTGDGRVWLAGDAIHLTGPVGIQSMNVGMREAVDLSDHVAHALVTSDGRDGFASYGRERTREWRRLLGIDPVVAGSGADPWVAQNRERILPCLPGSGEVLEALAGQIGLAFEHKAVMQGG